MEAFLKITFLAIIQGITEFLPISSSGHLALIQKIFNIHGSETVLVTVVLHAGTLIAILIFYFAEIINLFSPNRRKAILLIIIGSIPAAIFGFLIKGFGIDDALFSNMYIPGFGLLITGCLLKFGINKSGGDKIITDLNYKDSIFIGLFQAFAILPGISRSGSTISGSLIKKLNKNDAATFSFLLAIPALAGAAVVEIVSSSLKSGSDAAVHSIPTSGLIIGFFISLVVGYFSLKFLIKILQKGKLQVFAYYCLCLGIAVILWKFFS